MITLRLQVINEIRASDLALDAGQELKDAKPVRLGHQLLHFRVGQAGDQQVLQRPGVVDGHDRAVAGSRQGPGRVHDPLQDGVQVELLADAHHRLGESRQTGPERVDFRTQTIVLHVSFLMRGLDAGPGILSMAGILPPGTFENTSHPS